MISRSIAHYSGRVNGLPQLAVLTSGLFESMGDSFRLSVPVSNDGAKIIMGLLDGHPKVLTSLAKKKVLVLVLSDFSACEEFASIPALQVIEHNRFVIAEGHSLLIEDINDGLNVSESLTQFGERVNVPTPQSVVSEEGHACLYPVPPHSDMYVLEYGKRMRNEQIRGKSASLFYATSGRDMALVFANVRVIAGITVEFHGQVNEVFGCVQSPKTFSQLRPRDGIKRSLQI